MVSLGFHLLFQKVINDRKQRYLPFTLEIFQDGRCSRDLFLSWFEQMECSYRGMRVADGIFFLAGLENKPNSKLNF